MHAYPGDHDEQLKREAESFSDLVQPTDTVRAELMVGKIDFLPAAFMKEHSVDLIVMGSHGRDLDCEEEGVCLGEGYTHTSKLLSRLDHTFLIVPHNRTYQPIRKLLITTDLQTPISDEQARQMSWLIDTYKPEVHYGHASVTGSKGEQGIAEFKEAADRTLGIRSSECHEVTCETEYEGIYKLANTVEADMVVAFSQHRNFIERLTQHSFTRTLAERLDTPLLILPK